MENTPEYVKFYHLAKILHDRGDDYPIIKQKLLEKLPDEILVNAIVKTLKEEYDRKKHDRGRIIMLAGLIILLISFVLTCINFHSNESITYVMFGISSVGLIVMFFGLYDLFG
ncbi:MAG: hypothetical protein ACXVPN_04335 [Bacteroidia bacterium]